MPAGEHIHLLGVGGMGMLPLALLLAQSGYRVTGEDDFLEAETARMLQAASVELAISSYWRTNALPDRFGYSPAVGPEHPTRLWLEAQDVPGRPRGEILAELIGDRKLIAVAGSHGKSSTAGALVAGFKASGVQFGYYVGALFQDPQHPPASLGSGEWFIAEVDESDGTIELFAPDILVLTDVSFDHPGRYKSQAAYNAVFNKLKERTVGSTILGKQIDDDGLRAERDRLVEQVAIALDLPAQPVRLALNDFSGLKRRQEVLLSGGTEGVTIVQDYAHHPREIEALLSDPRYAGATVVFEPHRFERTAALRDDFVSVFQSASIAALHVLPIYAAFESDQQISSLSIASSIAGARYYQDYETALNYLTNEDLSGQVLLFVGAGPIVRLAEAFVASQICIQRNVELAGKTTMRVGGAAEFYAEPEDACALRGALNWARWSSQPVTFLGRGSNVVITDKGVRGLVLRLSHDNWKQVERLPGGRIRAGGGMRLRDICLKASQWRVSGLEFMEGIPATLGGALRMNAGAMGRWMSDILVSVQMMHLDGTVSVYPAESLSFAYRSTRELAEGIVLDAVLAGGASNENTAAIRDTMHTYMRSRKESQPREASAGCIFKNPDGDHAGRLIDVCGLKGRSFGGATVSETHANFIVNTGDATAADIVSLVKIVRSEVAAQTGVLLQPEVILLGEKSWEEVLES